MSLTPRERRRRALIAVLLAGFAPPGGHVYIGNPLRGFVLLAMSLVAGWAWVLAIPRSLHLAQGLGLSGALLLLAVIVDAGLLARKSPDELPPRPLHRWWVYALLILTVQWAVPDLLYRQLKQRAGIAVQADRSMEPLVLEDERIVFERLRGDELARRDLVVVLEDDHGALLLRRVAGLPGETIVVKDGLVTIDGRPWLEDALRPRRRPDLDLEETRVGLQDLLVLADRRRATDPVQGLVPLGRVQGRASWVLLPPGFPRDPQYGVRLGESLR